MSNITIRAFEMADWEAVAELFLAPHCQWGTLQLPYQSRDDIKKKLENPPDNLRRLVAVLPDIDKVVGMLGLHLGHGRRAHTAGIGMMVHDTYQGRGVGSALMEAAIELAEDWLQLRRLELTVFTDNAPAIHLYKKYGFIIEGTLKQYAYRAGQDVDVYTMARLKEA